MDYSAFASVSRALTNPQSGSTTRRRMTQLLGGLVLGGPVALLGLSGVEAKCKKKCGPCKRCKKGKCEPKGAGTACTGGTCQKGTCIAAASSPSSPSSPPPPPGPPPTGPGICNLSGSTSAISGNRRFAQTFLPPAGTSLTTAQVALQANPINFELTVQIRTVDGAGKPTATSLGTTIIRSIPATGLPGPPRAVEAIFNPPVTITPGQLHALVVTGPNGVGYTLLHNTGNRCPDGQRFFDTFATDDFKLAGGGDDDLLYAVTVV